MPWAKAGQEDVGANQARGRKEHLNTGITGAAVWAAAPVGRIQKGALVFLNLSFKIFTALTVHNGVMLSLQ